MQQFPKDVHGTISWRLRSALPTANGEMWWLRDIKMVSHIAPRLGYGATDGRHNYKIMVQHGA